MINVSKDFSRFPAGRFRTDGEYSGERFRDDFLIKALTDNESVDIELDGVAGYGSSFLEEAFGGLIRVHKLDKNSLVNRLHFHTTNRLREEEIWRYIKQA